MLDTIEGVASTGTLVCFVDETRSGTFCGFPILPLSETLDAGAVIALATPARRREVAGSITRFTSLTASTALVSPHSQIGEDAILCHHVTVEAGARIGRHFHGNLYSYIAHESEIGDFVTFAPRVSCNGRVRIGDGVYVGTGASIKQGITIGANAVIGMGAVVIRDVPAGATIVGNPAQSIRQG